MPGRGTVVKYVAGYDQHARSQERHLHDVMELWTNHGGQLQEKILEFLEED